MLINTFGEVNPYTGTKKPVLDRSKLYSFRCKGCSLPVVGRIMEEYDNSASMQIVEVGNNHDKKLLKTLNNRVCVSKKQLREVD